MVGKLNHFSVREWAVLIGPPYLCVYIQYIYMIFICSYQKYPRFQVRLSCNSCQHSNQLCGSTLSVCINPPKENIAGLMQTPGGIWRQADGLAAAKAGHYYTRFDDGIYRYPCVYVIMVDNICIGLNYSNLYQPDFFLMPWGAVSKSSSHPARHWRVGSHIDHCKVCEQAGAGRPSNWHTHIAAHTHFKVRECWFILDHSTVLLHYGYDMR